MLADSLFEFCVSTRVRVTCVCQNKCHVIGYVLRTCEVHFIDTMLPLLTKTHQIEGKVSRL